MSPSKLGCTLAHTLVRKPSGLKPLTVARFDLMTFEGGNTMLFFDVSRDLLVCQRNKFLWQYLD